MPGVSCLRLGCSLGCTLFRFISCLPLLLLGGLRRHGLCGFRRGPALYCRLRSLLGHGLRSRLRHGLLRRRRCLGMSYGLGRRLVEHMFCRCALLCHHYWFLLDGPGCGLLRLLAGHRLLFWSLSGNWLGRDHLGRSSLHRSGLRRRFRLSRLLFRRLGSALGRDGGLGLGLDLMLWLSSRFGLGFRLPLWFLDLGGHGLVVQIFVFLFVVEFVDIVESKLGDDPLRQLFQLLFFFFPGSGFRFGGLLAPCTANGDRRWRSRR